MKVQFGICFRCARRVEVFSLARAKALKMRNDTNPRTCQEMPVLLSMVPRSSALIAAHVLTGATQLVGAGRSEKTPVRDRNRKPFGYSTAKQRRINRHG